MSIPLLTAGRDDAAELVVATRYEPSLREGLRYFWHSTRLRLSTIDLAGTALGRKLAFGVVGLSGFLPNLSVLWLLTAPFAVPYEFAAVLATQVAIVWNFLLIDRVLFTGARRWGWCWRFGSFAVLNNADLLWRIPLLVLLVDTARIGLLPATVVTLLVAFAARFVITDRLIYLRSTEQPGQNVRGQQRVAECDPGRAVVAGFASVQRAGPGEQPVTRGGVTGCGGRGGGGDER